MKNDDAKFNRIRSEPKITPAISGIMTKEQLAGIRDALYMLVDVVDSPSELHIHTTIAEETAKILEGKLVSFGKDCILIYDGEIGIWKDARFVLEGIAEAVYISGQGNRDEICTKIALLTMKDRSEFDSVRKRYIGLKNGTWDITEWKFIPHDSGQHLLTTIPVDYSESATCPNIEKFISEIVLHDDIPVIGEWIGYCLVDDMFIHQALMLHGKGQNGKSVLINLIIKFLGEKNTTSISLHRLAESHFAAADLYGKKSNLYADLSHDALKDTGTFKVLVGGDQMTGEKKFRDAFHLKTLASRYSLLILFPALRISQMDFSGDGV